MEVSITWNLLIVCMYSKVTLRFGKQDFHRIGFHAMDSLMCFCISV